MGNRNTQHSSWAGQNQNVDFIKTHTQKHFLHTHDGVYKSKQLACGVYV